MSEKWTQHERNFKPSSQSSQSKPKPAQASQSKQKKAKTSNRASKSLSSKWIPLQQGAPTKILRRSAQNIPTAQSSPQRPKMTQNARAFFPNLPKSFQNLPKIFPKSVKIEPKSRPDGSKSTFEDHSKYKHEKESLQNNPKSPKSFQTLPETSPEPSQSIPENLGKQYLFREL